MQAGLFRVTEKRPIRENMTISRSSELGGAVPVTWFSMGAGTSVSQEIYDRTALYLGEAGKGCFLFGEKNKAVPLEEGEILVVPAGLPCGVEAPIGFIYTEIVLTKEIVMTEIIKPGEVMKLKDLIGYEENSIANLDLFRGEKMKFVLMAFDAGTGLTPHRAPGDVILTALEGKAVIGYEGKDYTLSEGESFRFAKNGLHSVTADGQFKMSLLMVKE